jgi:lysophospholipase L1-like esterase
LTVAIAGVLGTLTSTSVFTRAINGAEVPVANPVTVTPIVDDNVLGVVYDLNEYTAVLWLGRNGTGASQGETDVSIYTAVIGKIRNLIKRIIILPVFNGGYSQESNGDPAIPTAGTQFYDAIMARNASVAAAFPQYFYDIRRDFIDGSAAWLQANYPAIYTSDWGQAFADRTQANLGPDSSWDVVNDVPPRAMRGDAIHLNNYGNEFLARLLATKIQSLNW